MPFVTYEAVDLSNLSNAEIFLVMIFTILATLAAWKGLVFKSIEAIFVATIFLCINFYIVWDIPFIIPFRQSVLICLSILLITTGIPLFAKAK